MTNHESLQNSCLLPVSGNACNQTPNSKALSITAFTPGCQIFIFSDSKRRVTIGTLSSSKRTALYGLSPRHGLGLLFEPPFSRHPHAAPPSSPTLNPSSSSPLPMQAPL